MGLDASVRCRCFEKGKLKPGPVPYEDLFVDEEGYLASHKLADAYSKYSYRQIQARYSELERAFYKWSIQSCEHEHGDYCSAHVGNWSGVRMFCHWCEEIGEERLPILSSMMPRGNGGIFPAEKAAAALAELDLFDVELDALLEKNPTYMLVDVATGEEVWSPEDDDLKTFESRSPSLPKADMIGGAFAIVDVDHHKGKVVFSSKHFTQKPILRPNATGKPRDYELRCLDSGANIVIFDSLGLSSSDEAEFTVGSRKAWSFTHANIALRALLNASLETGNPIRWC